MSEDTGATPDGATDTYVADVLRRIPPETYAQVLKGILEAGGGHNQQLVTAYNSGVAYGAETAFEEFHEGFDDAANIMLDAVKQLDAMMLALPAEAVKQMAAVRNPMAEFLNREVVIQSRSQKVEEVTGFFACPLAYLDAAFDADGLSDEAYMALAVSVAGQRPESVPAYLTFRDDPRLPCKCPGHCVTAWRDLHPVQQAQQGHALFNKFPPGTKAANDAMLSFAKWWLAEARKAYAIALAEQDPDLPPPMSEAESKLVTDDSLGKLMAGWKAGRKPGEPSQG